MTIKLQKKSNHKFIIKLASLFFGYVFWLIFAQQQIIQTTVEVPLAFELSNPEIKIEAPSNVKSILSGKRLDLQKINFKNIIAHVDVRNLAHPEKHSVQVKPEHFFLPANLKLLYYSPVFINIELS